MPPPQLCLEACPFHLYSQVHPALRAGGAPHRKPLPRPLAIPLQPLSSLSKL